MLLWIVVFIRGSGICQKLMILGSSMSGSSSILSDPRDDSASPISYSEREFILACVHATYNFLDLPRLMRDCLE